MANEVSTEGAVGIQFAARPIRKRYCERRKNTSRFINEEFGSDDICEVHAGVRPLQSCWKRHGREEGFVRYSDNFEANEGPEGDCIVTATPCRGCWHTCRTRLRLGSSPYRTAIRICETSKLPSNKTTLVGASYSTTERRWRDYPYSQAAMEETYVNEEHSKAPVGLLPCLWSTNTLYDRHEAKMVYLDWRSSRETLAI